MRMRNFLVLCFLGLTAAPSSAQPATRPAVSPYLNLLRPGNSAGINYNTLVRPQLEFRNGIQDLQQQVTGNQAVIADLSTATLPTTGHKTSFLNTAGYYSGGGSGAGGFGPQAVTRPMGPGGQGQPAKR